jgi:hypothetical protein
MFQSGFFTGVDGPQSWSWAGSDSYSASLRGPSGQIVNIPATAATRASTSVGDPSECTRHWMAFNGVPCAAWDATVVVVMAVG